MDSGVDIINKANLENGEGTSTLLNLGGINGATIYEDRELGKTILVNKDETMILGYELIHALKVMNSESKALVGMKINRYIAPDGVVESEIVCNRRIRNTWSR